MSGEEQDRIQRGKSGPEPEERREKSWLIVAEIWVDMEVSPLFT